MYDQIASRDIALTLLILFISLFAWILVMNILTGEFCDFNRKVPKVSPR